jgi:hypothetical protein
MDEDLSNLDRAALVAEVKRLRAGIREHRDSFGHELCWHHPRLWGLLPEKSDQQPTVPAWPQFLRGCIQYRECWIASSRMRRERRTSSRPGCKRAVTL